MAEYIDREQLLELINEDCKYKNPTNEYTRGCNEVCDWAIKMIKNIPTADVVQKSKVEELKGELAIAERHEKDARALFKDAVIQLQNARQEVAREIFESIEECIYLYYNKNDYTMPNIEEDIAELKKKYMEGQNDEKV